MVTRFLFGGSEQRLIDAVRSMPDADIHMICGMDDGVDRLPAGDGAATVQVSVLPSLVRDPNPMSDLKSLRQIRAAIRQLRPHIVHTHQAKAGVLGRLAAIGTDAYVIHSASNELSASHHGRLGRFVFDGIERLTAPTVDRYAVVGSDLGSQLSRQRIPQSKIFVVRSSLDLGDFIESRPNRSVWSGGPIRVIYVGSLEPRKGVGELPGFCRSLAAASGCRVELTVAGVGPLGDRLERNAAIEGPDVELRMLGYRKDVDSLMSASDLAVLLSSAEGLPQFLVQASAADLPFAAYRVGGVGELATLGARCVTAAAGDIDGLAAKAARMLRDHASGGGQIVGVPVEVFKEWDPDLVDAHYRDLYRQAFV